MANEYSIRNKVNTVHSSTEIDILILQSVCHSVYGISVYGDSKLQRTEHRRVPKVITERFETKLRRSKALVLISKCLFFNQNKNKTKTVAWKCV